MNYGGAIHLSNSTLVATNMLLTFTNNRAQVGGAIAIFGLQILNPFKLLSTIMVEGTSLFDANVATISGCALYDHSLMYILFIGNTTLSGNGEQKPLTSSEQIYYNRRKWQIFNSMVTLKSSTVLAVFEY